MFAIICDILFDPTPLRGYLKLIKNMCLVCNFVSISGGADGSNPNLMHELMERTGENRLGIPELHIV